MTDKHQPSEVDHPLAASWRLAMACIFSGGACVVFGALLWMLYLQTTPVTYVTQIHKANVEQVGPSVSAKWGARIDGRR